MNYRRTICSISAYRPTSIYISTYFCTFLSTYASSFHYFLVYFWYKRWWYVHVYHGSPVASPFWWPPGLPEFPPEFPGVPPERWEHHEERRRWNSSHRIRLRWIWSKERHVADPMGLQWDPLGMGKYGKYGKCGKCEWKSYDLNRWFGELRRKNPGKPWVIGLEKIGQLWKIESGMLNIWCQKQWFPGWARFSLTPIHWMEHIETHGAMLNIIWKHMVPSFSNWFLDPTDTPQ